MALRRCVIWTVVISCGVLCLNTVTAAGAVTQTYMIDDETRIDSRSSTYNYGVSTSVRAIVNGNDGSLVRSLVGLPQEMWSIPAGQTLLSAKIYFYTWQNNTGDRSVQLHPLTGAFIEGSGDGTLSGDGATWLTYDGVHTWSSGGGDYDQGTFVTADESTNWFTWDITTLWTNSNLRTYGALLRMNDESNPGAGNQPRVTLTSHEGAEGSRPYVEVTYIPEPASIALFGLLAGVAAIRRRSVRPSAM